MPRSNQSGGPWGSGPGPPDLEEFLRRGQDRLRGLMRGNLGARGFALLALAAVVLWGFSGFFRVEPSRREATNDGRALAIVLLILVVVAHSTFFTVYQTRQPLVVRLGQPVRVATEPGLNAKIPFIDSVMSSSHSLPL